MPRSLLRQPDQMTTGDVAAYLSEAVGHPIARSTILGWLRAGKIPQPRRTGVTPTWPGRRIWTRAEAEDIKSRLSPLLPRT